MQEKKIGICSHCGGFVTIPTVWYSTEDPVPTCQKCGAVAESNLPVVKMKEPASWTEYKKWVADSTKMNKLCW